MVYGVVTYNSIVNIGMVVARSLTWLSMLLRFGSRPSSLPTLDRCPNTSLARLFIIETNMTNVVLSKFPSSLVMA